MGKIEEWHAKLKRNFRHNNLSRAIILCLAIIFLLWMIFSYASQSRSENISIFGAAPFALIFSLVAMALDRYTFQIQLESQILSISKEIRSSLNQKERNYYKIELAYGKLNENLRYYIKGSKTTIPILDYAKDGLLRVIDMVFFTFSVLFFKKKGAFYSWSEMAKKDFEELARNPYEEDWSIIEEQIMEEE